ncbi:PDZ domain-containing protein [Flavobacterium channae]|uniref:PDZ domain-containing protein n=1 Tax=Flavobacterium channae TaxID=2897181 RepID=UPI001E635D6F|nr:PDZ domain-containing protein [Flavobacterium channae]UGS24385.1 PDZ domain-containing protein [Flavobacterium channae]
MTKLFFLRILIFFTFFSFAQDSIVWKSKRDIIKIPFELSHNLMIVDVVFNGVKLKMIADTGASKSIVFSLPENDSLEVKEANLISISGAGISEKVEGYLSKKNTLQIHGFQDNNFEAIFVFNHDISLVNKLGIPINGILGSSFFKKYLVEIDYERKKIFLHKSKQKKLKKIANDYVESTIEINKSRPYIFLKTKLENEIDDLKLLFDTGLGDGLWLFENDKIKSNSIFFIDYLGKGLSGDIFGKKSRVEEVTLENNVLKGVLVSYPDINYFDKTMIVDKRNGSLGGEVIKRFNWILDYENQKVYFRKNTLFDKPFNYNMAGIEVQHSGFHVISEKMENAFSTNVINLDNRGVDYSSERFIFELKPNFEIYSVRKDSPGDKAGLLIGDKIIEINNRPAHKLSIQSITDLFQSEEGKPITIVVEREGKILTFKFNLEKVL